MNLRSIFYFLVCLQTHLFSQIIEKKDSLFISGSNCDPKVFYSLADAAKADPDSVLYLHLGNNGIKKFPMEILRYKNLRLLDLCNLNLLEQFRLTPWLLSETDTQKVHEIYEKHKDAGDKGIYLFFPTENKTIIRKIPIEIKQLTNLKLLFFEGGIFYKRKVKRLQKLLPNCEIDSE